MIWVRHYNGGLRGRFAFNSLPIPSRFGLAPSGSYFYETAGSEITRSEGSLHIKDRPVKVRIKQGLEITWHPRRKVKPQCSESPTEQMGANARLQSSCLQYSKITIRHSGRNDGV